jgi:hypothetical protein
MKTPPFVLRLALTLAALTLAACTGDGGTGDASPSPSGGSPLPAESRSESYAEGTVTIGISLLDVGLLKGEAAVETAEGWRVAALKVTATDPKGAGWGVLEFPEGVGSSSASEFFEVQVQELARGEQVEITVTATFESDAGERVERQARDVWPP